MWVRSLDLLSELRIWQKKKSGIAINCGVGYRCGSDLVLLWMWCRPVATAPIRPLAWELPCATGVALKRQTENQNPLPVTLYHIGLFGFFKALIT